MGLGMTPASEDIIGRCAVSRRDRRKAPGSLGCALPRQDDPARPSKPAHGRDAPKCRPASVRYSGARIVRGAPPKCGTTECRDRPAVYLGLAGSACPGRASAMVCARPSVGLRETPASPDPRSHRASVARGVRGPSRYADSLRRVARATKRTRDMIDSGATHPVVWTVHSPRGSDAHGALEHAAA